MKEKRMRLERDKKEVEIKCTYKKIKARKLN